MLTTYHYAHTGKGSGIDAIPGTLGASFEETCMLAERLLAKRLREVNDESATVIISSCEVDIHAVVLGDAKATRRELMKRARRVYGGI